MNKKIVLLFVVISLVGLANLAFAQTVENPLKGINDFPALLGKIADVVGTIIGSLAILMLIVAGIFFLLSAGNPNMITRAKAALTYAIIGAVIGLAAKGIVLLVEKVIGVPGT